MKYECLFTKYQKSAKSPISSLSSYIVLNHLLMFTFTNSLVVWSFTVTYHFPATIPSNRRRKLTPRNQKMMGTIIIDFSKIWAKCFLILTPKNRNIMKCFFTCNIQKIGLQATWWIHTADLVLSILVVDSDIMINHGRFHPTSTKIQTNNKKEQIKSLLYGASLIYIYFSSIGMLIYYVILG